MTSARIVLVCGLMIPLAAGCRQEPSTDEARVVAVFGETGLGNGQFSYPRCVAVSPIDGKVFVCDKTARIQRFDEKGNFETGWRMPAWENGKPTGMAFDKEGRLWVADTHYARVMVYDRDGKELFQFGSRGEGPGQFIFPTCIAWDNDGNIYIGEYGGNDRINKFSKDRKWLTAFGGRDSGEASLERPTQIKFDPRGFLWVSDGCHHRICKFSLDGKMVGTFGAAGNGPGQLSYPYDLELTKGGGVIVTEHGNNRVSEFDGAGKFVRSWGTPGRETGQLMQPWKAQFGRDAILFIVDAWNNRIQAVRW